MMRYVSGCIIAVCLCCWVAVPAAVCNEAPTNWKVESISFSGNSAFDDGRLRDVMVTQASGFLNSRPFYQSVLDVDTKSLHRFYVRQGYLQAEVAGFDVERDSTRGEVNINITVIEGPLTRMEKASVFGNTVFQDSLILARIDIRPGDPYRQKAVEDAVTTIMRMYADLGYLEGEVAPKVQVNTETNLAIVDFIIDERDQFRIADIAVETLLKTRPHVVRRELLFREGEVIKYGTLLKSQRRLYLTGLFSSVFIRPRAPTGGDSAMKDIVVEIKEKESIELAVGIGYGSVERARGSLEISNYNMLGTAVKTGVAGEASLIRRRVEASLTDPRVFGLPIRGDMSVRYQYLNEPGYVLERRAGRVSLGRRLGDWTRISLAWSYVDDNLLRVDVEEIPEDLKANLRTLELSVTYDTRDDISNTTQGVYAEWINDLAGIFLGGTDSFTRSTFGLRYFHRLTPHTTIASALEVGWMESKDALREIPLGERFYAGGPNTLRGFGYQLVGPLDRRRTPVGGLFKSVINLVEVRQDIYKMLGVAVFVDAGNVWSHVEAFRPRDFRSSAGAGIRVNTPIGILRGDLGVNLDPKDREPRTTFHFSVGQAF